MFFCSSSHYRHRHRHLHRSGSAFFHRLSLPASRLPGGNSSIGCAGNQINNETATVAAAVWVLSSRFSVLRSRFSLLRTQFSVRSSQSALGRRRCRQLCLICAKRRRTFAATCRQHRCQRLLQSAPWCCGSCCDCLWQLAFIICCCSSVFL